MQFELNGHNTFLKLVNHLLQIKEIYTDDMFIYFFITK